MTFTSNTRTDVIVFENVQQKKNKNNNCKKPQSDADDNPRTSFAYVSYFSISAQFGWMNLWFFLQISSILFGKSIRIVLIMNVSFSSGNLRLSRYVCTLWGSLQNRCFEWTTWMDKKQIQAASWTLWANQWSHVTKNWNDVRIIVWPSLTFIH